jgi:hypothetical protein
VPISFTVRSIICQYFNPECIVGLVIFITCSWFWRRFLAFEIHPRVGVQVQSSTVVGTLAFGLLKRKKEYFTKTMGGAYLRCME